MRENAIETRSSASSGGRFRAFRWRYGLGSCSRLSRSDTHWRGAGEGRGGGVHETGIGGGGERDGREVETGGRILPLPEPPVYHVKYFIYT